MGAERNSSLRKGQRWRRRVPRSCTPERQTPAGPPGRPGRLHRPAMRESQQRFSSRLSSSPLHVLPVQAEAQQPAVQQVCRSGWPQSETPGPHLFLSFDLDLRSAVHLSQQVWRCSDQTPSKAPQQIPGTKTRQADASTLLFPTEEGGRRGGRLAKAALAAAVAKGRSCRENHSEHLVTPRGSGPSARTAGGNAGTRTDINVVLKPHACLYCILLIVFFKVFF